MWGCLLHALYWGPGPEPRHEPNWESNRRPFGSQAGTQSTEQHQPGLVMRIFKIYSLSNFQICNTVLLTIVTMLYIIFPWFIYFITGNLYLLTTSIHFAHPLPLATTNLFSASMSLVFCLFFFLDFTYKWHHIVDYSWYLPFNHGKIPF